MKKSLKFILMVLLITLMIPQQTLAAQFTDVKPNSWYYQNVTDLVSRGIINGYNDGTFKPNAKISIAEFTKLVISTLNVEVEPTGTYWASGYMDKANELDILLNTEAPNPSEYITRELATKMIVQTDYILNSDQPVDLKYNIITDSQTIKPEYTEHIQRAINRGLITGYADGSFKAKEGLTRAEASTIISRLIKNDVTIQPTQPEIKEVTKLKLGISESDLINLLGNPDRKDASEQGYTWYVYNKNIGKFIMIGVQDSKVRAIYTTNNEWDISEFKVGEKLNVKYNDTPTETSKHIPELDTFVFLDKYSNNIISSILIHDENMALGNFSNYAEIEKAYEAQMIDITNAYRHRHGLKLLKPNDTLNLASRKHSQDMATRNFFAHTNPDGDNPTARAKKLGYNKGVGENIAAGYVNAIYATNGWYNSEGHRRNLLNSDYEYIGTGFARNANNPGTHKIFYTQNFSR